MRIVVVRQLLGLIGGEDDVHLNVVRGSRRQRDVMMWRGPSIVSRGVVFMIF